MWTRGVLCQQTHMTRVQRSRCLSVATDNLNFDSGSDFLKTISETELDGFEVLLDFAKKLMRSRNPEVGEGITRPRHMLLELEASSIRYAQVERTISPF